MIVTQLAEFLNNTMIPQYLGKEAIKVEDLSPIVSVGAYTMVEGPPVEPTKIAAMKTTDYTEGTATIVNTEGETSFGALSSGVEIPAGPPDYGQLTFSLSDCITQEADGIGIAYTGRITYPLDITEDNYIVTFTTSISELTEISGVWSIATTMIGIMGYCSTNNNILVMRTNTSNNVTNLVVECETDIPRVPETLFDTDIDTATYGYNTSSGNSKASIIVPLEDAGLSSSDLEDDVSFMLISVDDYIVVVINDIVICTIDKAHITFGTGTYTFYTGYTSTTEGTLSYTGTIKEFEIFEINEE